MEIDAVVRGASEEAALLDRLSRRAGWPWKRSPRVLAVIDLMLASQHERFEGRGTRWKRLKVNTRRWHHREGAGDDPLILTRVLMRSLTIRGARGQIVRFSRTTFTFGTSIWYAHFHQKGQGVPKRTVVGVTRRDRLEIVRELGRLLVED